MDKLKVASVDLGTIHRTLFSAGFVVTNFSRKPLYIAFHAFRSDEFGVKANYLIAFSESENSPRPTIKLFKGRQLTTPSIWF